MKANIILSCAIFISTSTNLIAQSWSGTTPGNIYYNSGWVGIGSNNPQSLLHINSDIERQTFRIYKTSSTTNYLSLWQGVAAAAIDPIGTQKLYIGYDNPVDIYMASQGGKVGVGTFAPSSQLHLSSNSDHALLMSRSDGTYGFRIFRNATEGAFYFQIGSSTNTWETKIRIGEGEGTNTNLSLNPSNGNVLIGKISQVNTSYKLDVNGKIRSNEIVVNANGADFVFDPTYHLPTLNQVKEFIAINKHLPDIESATEMQQNGVELGKLNIKLLQKIEEMTLYMIELKQEIEDVKSENKELKIKVTELEKKQ